MFKKSSIASRFIIYIVFFSSFITLVITASQLYRDYNNDLGTIYSELDDIETVHLESLTEALWVSNPKLLQTNIEGILKIQDIQYVTVFDERKTWASAGKILGKKNIERSYAMKYLHQNELVNIGTLTVSASLDGVYQRLIDKVWVILISNGIKTALVALFIYIVFYQLVARHLLTISDFLKKQQPLSNYKPLVLNRSQSKKIDEFDLVVESINEMHESLGEQVNEIDRQKQQLSQTLNSIGDAVITTDAKGFVTRLNPIAEQLTGWKHVDAVGKPLTRVFNIVNEVTGKPINNPVEKVIATGEPLYLSNHTTLISKNGNEYQIFDSAAPIRNKNIIVGVVLVFRNVTEQYKVRRELADSYARLEKISSRVPGMVYEFKLDSDGKMSFPYLSNAVNELYHLSAEEVQEDVNRIFSQTYPDDVEKLHNSIMESARTLTPWKLEYRVCNEKGNVRWLYGNSVPEKLSDGGILWYGFVTDITERKELDENLMRSQKMDAMGKLTGGIAHDFNNMLGVIMGYSELLISSLNNQAKLKNYVQQIHHAGERGAKLTKKLLSFSRRNPSTDVQVDINQLICDEQHMLEKTLTARIQLDLKLANDLWPVCIDGGELEDAILNISINAMHAIKNTGILRIETSNKQLGFHEAEGLCIEAGDYVQLQIADTGCGIDALTQEKIFDPFYSTKGENGTGLGLSQVYGFVGRCNGAIKVRSNLDIGTEFTLYFPRYIGAKKEKNISRSETKETEQTNLKETILVVDDEVALLNLTCEILRGQGYTVFSAENAQKALDILEEESIDLLLSDVIMPEMDGYSLARIVKEKYPTIKIQLASGYSGDYCTDNDCDEWSKNLLSKPYDSQQLLHQIQKLML